MTRRTPPRPALQEIHVPAPVGGLNTVAAGTAVPAGDCIQLVNLVSGEHGLRARLGYHRYGAMSNGRSLLPYTGSSGAYDKLYGVSSTNIYDIDAATVKVAFTNTTATESGRGVCHAFTTSAGNFLLYCDAANGYHVYTESTDTWAAVTQGGGASQVSGVDPATFAFVMVWKSRVWFVERNSNNVWYLPAGAIYGAATKLPLAQSAQFRHGGDLIGLWNWTLDGGSGIDDYLVAATRGGDVAIYQGTDPASASTFSLKGTWSAGAFVSGRRVATNFGGDLLLLTKSGIRPLSQLVSGGDGLNVYLTAKISNLFNALTLGRGELPGWDMCIHPEENALIVTVPKPGADEYNEYETEQLVYSFWSKSWSRYVDLPIQAMCVWNKKLFFTDRYDGGLGNNVWKNEGYMDSVGPGLTATPVQWSLLTPFSSGGSARQKQVQLIRPTILSESTMDTVEVQARYDYNLATIADQTEGSATGNVWDVALWDAGTWSDDYTARSPVRAATGVGHKVAIAIKGTARSRTVLVGMDVLYTTGGVL